MKGGFEKFKACMQLKQDLQSTQGVNESAAVDVYMVGVMNSSASDFISTMLDGLYVSRLYLALNTFPIY